MRNKLKIRTGDLVKVVSGNQRGSQGKVLKVFSVKNKVIVEGVNVVKKHNKPSSKNPKGGITDIEAPINISNISLLNSNGETTRVGYKIIDGEKKRFGLKSDEII